MLRLYLVWLVILLSSGWCIFEWVHPENWMPDHEPAALKQDAQQVGDQVKEAAGEAKQKARDIRETIMDKAHRAGEAVRGEAKEVGEDLGERFQQLRRKSHEDVYEPMVRMMKHALHIWDEEDRLMEKPLDAIHRGWPSRYETNPKMWREYPEEYLLFLDVPGIPRSELAVNIAKSSLVISGHHGACLRPHKQAVGDERFCLERGVMERIRLPEDVDPRALECKFKDGVLIVRMPKLHVEQKQLKVEEYKAGWAERAKEAREKIMDTVGIHHDEHERRGKGPYYDERQAPY